MDPVTTTAIIAQSADQICISAGSGIVGGIAGIIATFSVIANFVNKDSIFGKVIHWLAVNIRTPKA